METLALIMAGGQRGRLTPLTDPLQYTCRSIRHTIPVIILDEHLGRVDQDNVIGYDPVTDGMGFEETQSGLVVLRLAHAEGRASLFSIPPCPDPAAPEAL